ncbi:MAG: hypothetical protein M0R74_18790 [Dehalococcoidia bacterium]|jgi:5-methylcytosine-specific restriction endonuclease McrA|nr:hypothetical protein [Dehalococcoidia bacterium]
MKTCTKCKAEYPATHEYFHKNIAKQCGLNSLCKACACIRTKKWAKENPQKAKERLAKWRVENPGRNLGYRRKWYSANREKAREFVHKWEKANPERVREIGREKAKRKNATTKGKLNTFMRCGIYRSVAKGAKGGKRWEFLIGYTVDRLKQHLEKKFTPEMSWENYGTYWQIDHVIPIAVFNFAHPSDIDFQKCWSLKNLQPMEAKENRRKSDKLNKPFQPSLRIAS